MIPAMTIVLTNPEAEDYSKAIQAIFWMEELKETLAGFAKLNRPSDPGGEFQKVGGMVPTVEFIRLARLVHQHNAYRYVPSKLKLDALRGHRNWRKDKVPTAGTELIEFEEAFRNFVEEVVSKDESK